MIDLGALHFFLGISVTQSPQGLFLSQRKYTFELLQCAHMVECHPSVTPVGTRAKLSALDGSLVANPMQYRSSANAL